MTFSCINLFFIKQLLSLNILRSWKICILLLHVNLFSITSIEIASVLQLLEALLFYDKVYVCRSIRIRKGGNIEICLFLSPNFFKTRHVIWLNNFWAFYLILIGFYKLAVSTFSMTIIYRRGNFVNRNNVCIILSCMASKPFNILWIWTGSQPYWKIMYCIKLQTIFHEF